VAGASGPTSATGFFSVVVPSNCAPNYQTQAYTIVIQVVGQNATQSPPSLLFSPNDSDAVTIIISGTGGTGGGGSANLSAATNVTFTTTGQDVAHDITVGDNKGGLRFFGCPDLTPTPDCAAIQFFGNASSGFPGQLFLDAAANNYAAIIFRTAGTGEAITERMRMTSDGWLGVGTPSPQDKLEVRDGNIRVTNGSFIDQGVSLNVPDYVFDSDYPLLPLADLQEYVSREKHLPNVPSASEIRQHGLNLTGFQMRLLEKVEELTLYLLDQHGQISDLRMENADLRATVVEQEARINALEVRLAALEQASKSEATASSLAGVALPDGWLLVAGAALLGLTMVTVAAGRRRRD
jgi:hypothetical protein